jgi:hypothetical protein
MSLRTFGLFIGFSDDRRLEVLAWFGIAVFGIIIIIVVGVSRRHGVAHDGDDAPFDQPGGNVLGDACSHFGSCWASWRLRRDVSARPQRKS